MVGSWVPFSSLWLCVVVLVVVVVVVVVVVLVVVGTSFSSSRLVSIVPFHPFENDGNLDLGKTCRARVLGPIAPPHVPGARPQT